jgi:hypothetical protein
MREKVAVVVSDQPVGIVECLQGVGFNVGSRPIKDWALEYRNYYHVHLVVLDEVSPFQEDMGDAEEALGAGEQGPFVILLVNDNDRRVDVKAKHHKRIFKHAKSEDLVSLAGEIFQARRIDEIFQYID